MSKKEYQYKYYRQNKEHYAKLGREYVQKFPEKTLFKRIKHQAQRKGREFNLELEDIKIPTVCPVFKTPFVYGDKKYTASLDRIDSTKGYVKGNVQVISNLANMMKLNATKEEQEAFARWVLKNET